MMTLCVRSLVIVGLLAGAAGATPISYISACVVPVSFTPEGGDYGLGVLNIEGVQPAVFHYSDGSQGVALNVSFWLSTSLKSDSSLAGRTVGLFGEGALTLRDDEQNVLLGGTILDLAVEETFGNLGVFTATGLFEVESGSVLADFGSSLGAIYEIMLQVRPASLDDFGIPFAGNSNISLAPVPPEGAVPEPGPMCLLALGLGGLVALPWWRRGVPVLLDIRGQGPR
jgi:hypothetical protein